MAGTFGLGIGFQGTPREYTSLYMQRKQQEFAQKQMEEARRQKQEEQNQQYLDKFIFPHDVDYKLQPLMERAAFEGIARAQENMTKYPTTHKNPNSYVLQDVYNKAQKFKEMSGSYQEARELVKGGKYLVPPNFPKFLNEGRGDFTSNRTGFEKLYGVEVNENTGELSWNPKPKMDIPQENQQRIFNQPGAFTTDGSTFQISGVDHYREKLNIPFAKEQYTNMLLSSPGYKDNINVSYLEYAMQQPGFDPKTVQDAEGNFTPEFERKAEQYGWNKLIQAGQNLEKIQAVSKPGDTNININNLPPGFGTEQDESFIIAPSPSMVGVKNPTTGETEQYTWGGDQVRFKGIKVGGLDSDNMFSTDDNLKIEKGKNRETEVSQLAVRAVYKPGVKVTEKVDGKEVVRDLGGTAVYDNALTNPEIYNADNIEYQVLALGASDKEGGRTQGTAIPLSEVESALRQQMKAEREKIGKAWTKNDQERLDSAIKNLRARAEELNQRVPGYKAKTPATQPSTAAPKRRTKDKDGYLWEWTFDPVKNEYVNPVLVE